MDQPSLIQAAIEIVGREFGVSILQLTGRCRPWHVSDARLVCYISLRNVGMTYRQVGNSIGRTHGAVTHGVVRANNLMDTDPVYRTKATKCVAMVNELFLGKLAEPSC